MRFVTAKGALMAALCLTSCAGLQRSAGSRPELALRRGSAWATYSVKLPRITGPAATLELENGRLHGIIGARSLDVKIDGQGASGFGPGGPVSLTVTREGSVTRVEGMWNGAPVNLRFAPDRVKGSVVVWHGRTGVEQASCGYNLDKVAPNGALTGTSTCRGMPQETRLEVHAGAANVLAPNELAVLLVAALAAPPRSPNEEPI